MYLCPTLRGWSVVFTAKTDNVGLATVKHTSDVVPPGGLVMTAVTGIKYCTITPDVPMEVGALPVGFAGAGALVGAIPGGAVCTTGGSMAGRKVVAVGMFVGNGMSGTFQPVQNEQRRISFFTAIRRLHKLTYLRFLVEPELTAISPLLAGCHKIETDGYNLTAIIDRQMHKASSPSVQRQNGGFWR